MYLHVPATLSLSAKVEPAATGRDFNAKARRCNGAKRNFAFGLLPGWSALAKAGHPCLPAPLSLHTFKEQARERRTVSILPRFDGNATFIFC
jgi:hypothetical protein